MVHLQPVVVWKDGFPEMGTDYDKERHRRTHENSPKALHRRGNKAYAPQSTPTTSKLRSWGLQWQFNHNPHDGYWSLTEKPGWLAIKSQKAEKLRMAFQPVFQKRPMGYKVGVVTVKNRDFAQPDAPGGRPGIECIGNKFVGGGVIMEIGDRNAHSPALHGKRTGRPKRPPLQHIFGHGQGIYIRLSTQ